MPDGAVFSRSVHRLEAQQDGLTIGCIVNPLQLTQLIDVRLRPFFAVLLRLVEGFDVRWPLLKANRFSFRHPKVLRMYFHFASLPKVGPSASSRFA